MSLVAITLYVRGGGQESTDDAQIEAHIVNVAARIPGQVQKLSITDNQWIKAGDPILELDSEELKARLSAAEADLSAAQASRWVDSLREKAEHLF